MASRAHTSAVSGNALRWAGRAIALALVLAAATLASSEQPAAACSCVPPDPWALLERADGAFVGRLVQRREVGAGRAVLTFRVERSVKGGIGATVEVVTASSGAACGIETAVGRRVGLFLAQEAGAWVGNLCWQVSPEDLLAAADLPAPNGRGPVALLVGGRFGPARTLTLDARGRTLAYGLGRGPTSLLSPCPGGARIAELARSDAGVGPNGRIELAVRETTSLLVVRRQALDLPGWRFADALSCEDDAGSSIVVFASWAGDAAQRAALYRVRGGRLTTIWRGTAFLSHLDARVAYLRAGFTAAEVVRVDLRSGRATRLVRIPLSPALTPSSNGRLLAGVAYRLDQASRIILVDLRTRPPTVRSAPLAAPELLGDVRWISGRRFVFLPLGAHDTARVLDLELRTRSRFSWTAAGGVVVGRHAFGIGRRSLVWARLPAGPQRMVRRLPGDAEVIVAARR